MCGLYMRPPRKGIRPQNSFTKPITDDKRDAVIQVHELACRLPIYRYRIAVCGDGALDPAPVERCCIHEA